MSLWLLHFTAGRVGGVESVLDAHARLFAKGGHDVTTLSGADWPELSPNFLMAQRELEAGTPSAHFAELRDALVSRSRDSFRGADIVFIHNVLTMPFHLAWSAALWQLASEMTGTRFVAWVHDLAARNADYALPYLDCEPWALLRKAHPRVEYVAVSELRKRQLIELTNLDPKRCRVIPNGVSLAEFLSLSPNVAQFAKEQQLFKQDLVLLHPARLVRRKNMELGLHVVAELKKRGIRCRYLVTGAPDEHLPDSLNYARELRALRDALGLAEEVIFLHDLFTVTNGDLVSLYAVSDALFFPSKQEGFGIPPLEAALHRLPVFCADIEPMKSLIQNNVTHFDLAIAPSELAGILLNTLNRDAAWKGRKQVVREFSWDAIYTNYLAPLLQTK